MIVVDTARMAKRGLIALRERTRLEHAQSDDVRAWIDAVGREGFCVVPDFYDSVTCGQLRQEVLDLIDRYPDAVHSMSNGADRRIFGAERAAAGIRNFAEEPRLLNAARSILAGDAVNAFTLAGTISFRQGNLGSGEGWHRDSFFNQFKAIVYLSEVSQANGPFEYITRSHLVREKFADHNRYGVPLKSARIGDDAVQRLIAEEPDRHRVFTAAMGTLLLVDTTGIHRGMPLTGGERFALTNYYFPGKAFGPRLSEHFKPVLGLHVPIKI
jgi:hypothetical protein